MWKIVDFDKFWPFFDNEPEVVLNKWIFWAKPKKINVLSASYWASQFKKIYCICLKKTGYLKTYNMAEVLANIFSIWCGKIALQINISEKLSIFPNVAKHFCRLIYRFYKTFSNHFQILHNQRVYKVGHVSDSMFAHLSGRVLVTRNYLSIWESFLSFIPSKVCQELTLFFFCGLCCLFMAVDSHFK